jgi:hypothetical protein
MLLQLVFLFCSGMQSQGYISCCRTRQMRCIPVRTALKWECAGECSSGACSARALLLPPCTMAQPDRKIDRFVKGIRNSFTRRDSQPPPAATGNPPPPPTPAPSETLATPVRTFTATRSDCDMLTRMLQIPQKAKESRRMEILSSIRTVLDIAERVLDGCPIWGPKAAVASTSQVLKTMQACFSSPMQRMVYLRGWPDVAREHARHQRRRGGRTEDS